MNVATDNGTMDPILDIHAEVAAMELVSFQRYFPFRSHPFAVSVDGSHAILLPDQTIARNQVRDAIDHGNRLIIFVGPSGIGKTVIIENVISVIHDKYQSIKLQAAKLSKEENLTEIVQQIQPQTKFVRFFIDDAHNISREMAIAFGNFLKLLESEEYTCQIILVGRQYLLELVDHPDLKTFSEMSKVTISIAPMAEDSLHEYMSMRLNLAGLNSTQVITPSAVKTLTRASNGIPGRLNALATGSFRNAVENRHKKVKASDALLAVNRPDIRPSVAYSWLRRHPLVVTNSLIAMAMVGLVSYGSGKPWFNSVTRTAGNDVRIAIAGTIDFFSDHTDKESPQTVVTDDSNYERFIDPQKVVEDEIAQRKAAEQRASLLARLDQESRVDRSIPVISHEAPKVVDPEPLVDDQHSTEISVTPHVQPPSNNIKVPDDNKVPPILNVETSQPVLAPAKAISVENTPEVVQPNVSSTSIAPTAAAAHDLPMPPSEPKIIKPDRLKVASEKPTSVVPPISRALPSAHTQVSTAGLPEFCARMRPDTEAGRAYKRQVCVSANVHGDIYFKSNLTR